MTNRITFRVNPHAIDSYKIIECLGPNTRIARGFVRKCAGDWTASNETNTILRTGRTRMIAATRLLAALQD